MPKKTLNLAFQNSLQKPLAWFRNQSMRILLLFSLSLLLMSCNLFRSPSEPRSEEVKMKGESACGVDIRKTFKNYVAGSALPNDVLQSLDCINNEIDQFKSRTRSSTAGDVYSLDEISSFFGKYFEKVDEFGPANLKTYFKFKNFALGGGELKLSKVELTKIQSLIKDASPVLAEMSSYVPIYKMQSALSLDNPHDTDSLNKSVECLHKLIVILNRHLPGQTGAVFNFADLDVLDFLKPSEALSLSNTQTMQLVMSLKSMLVNPPYDSIAAEDFRHFMTQLGFIVETGLRIKYTKELKHQDDEVFLGSIETVRDTLEKLIKNSLAFQNSKSIPFKELVRFVKKLGRYDLIPYGLRESSVVNFMPVLLTKVMAKDPTSKAPVISELSFKREHLDVTLDAINEWISVQKTFLAALSNRKDISAGELIEKFNQSARSIKDPKIQAAFVQMKEIFDNGVFLRWKDREKLNFAPRSLDQKFTRYDLTYLATSFASIRAIMRGFLNSPDRRKNISAMTEPELTELYYSVREIGKDLKFIDTRNRSAPGRAFLENNIFTSVSNGNDLAEFHEAMEWFYNVWSAGKMGEKIYHLVPDKCKTKELDVFGNRKLSHDCYLAFFKENVTDFFEHLTSVNSYLKDILKNPKSPSIRSNSAPKKSASVDAWAEFDIALENAFRSTAHSNDDFDSPDTEAMALILSYTENIFINHSHAQNGMLDTEDIWRTYPIMRGFIEKASNGAAKTEFIKKGAYSYLIMFGEMPNVDHLLGMAKFGIWAVVRSFQKEIAHVPDMIKVISTFSLAGKAKKIKAIETYFTANKDMLEANMTNKEPKTLTDLKVLFFCSDDSIQDFTEKMKAGVPQIFSSGVDATQFHKNIEQLIKADVKLRLECLPFE